MIRRLGPGLALTLLATGILPPPALGQVALPSTERSAPEWDSDFAVAGQYQKGASLDAEGSFESMQYQAAAWVEGPLTQSIQLNFEASYTYTDYDFGPASPGSCGNPAACFANNPWQGINRLDLSPGASLAITPAIKLRLSFPIRWNAEGNAEGNAITGGIVTQLQWQISSRLVVGLGVGVVSQIEEEDTRVYPAISLDWKMASNLRLRTRGGPYQGGEIALIWSPSDFFQGILSAGYERQRFRLANSGLNPDGIAEATSVPLLVGLEFGFTSRLKIVAEGGMAVSGELRIEDHRGLLLTSSAYDSAGLLRGYFRYMF